MINLSGQVVPYIRQQLGERKGTANKVYEGNEQKTSGAEFPLLLTIGEKQSENTTGKTKKSIHG